MSERAHSSATLQFSVTVLITGVNPYVEVDAKGASTLRAGWRRPMPVLVKLNGGPDTPWRTNLMPVGRGEYVLYLHGGMRKSSGVNVGDVVTVALTFDSSYRNGPLHDSPEWFEEALEANEDARKNWKSLAPSRQKEVLRYFANLKSTEAKKRNLLQAMRVLSGEDERFMGRDWRNGK